MYRCSSQSEQAMYHSCRDVAGGQGNNGLLDWIMVKVSGNHLSFVVGSHDGISGKGLRPCFFRRAADYRRGEIHVAAPMILSNSTSKMHYSPNIQSHKYHVVYWLIARCFSHHALVLSALVSKKSAHSAEAYAPGGVMSDVLG